MTYYLGPAGNIAALPDPEAGLPLSNERVGGSHQLLSGNKVRDTLARLRSWELSYTAIDLATYGTLQSYYYGTAGYGPYYFYDAEQKNLLQPNVSSGTNATAGSTAGFESATCTPGSTTFAFGVAGPLALILSYTTGVAGGSEIVATGPGGAGTTNVTPVVPSVAHTFSAYVAFDAGSAIAPVINWLDSSYVFISAASGATDSTGAAHRSTLTGTAPSNARYAQVGYHTANTVASPHFVYTTGWQLEIGSAASSWVPGVGVPLVTVEGLSRSTPLAGVCDAQMTLVQVGTN